MASSYTLSPFVATTKSQQHAHHVPRPPSQPGPAGLFSDAALHSQEGLTPSPYYTHTQHIIPQLKLPLQQTMAPLPTAASAASAAPSSSSSSSPHARFYYKLVARVGPNRYFSLYDGTTEYVLGTTVSRPIRAAPATAAAATTATAASVLPPLFDASSNGSGDGDDTSGGNNFSSISSSGASTSRSMTARSGRVGGGGGSSTARSSSSSTARSSSSSSSSSSSGGGWKGDESRGGLFVCRTAEEATAARIPDVSALFCAPRALLKCICWGECVEYPGSSTLAFAYLRPVQVYPLALGYRCSTFGPRLLTNVALQETRKRLPRFNDPRHRTPVRAYMQRQEMGELTKTIQAMDSKINDITRAQLGW